MLNGSVQLEYDNIEGMILLSELSRRRIRSIQKLIRVGRNEVVVVLRVDKEKGVFHRSLSHSIPFLTPVLVLSFANMGCEMKATSTSQNGESRQRTSSSARSAS